MQISLSRKNLIGLAIFLGLSIGLLFMFLPQTEAQSTQASMSGSFNAQSGKLEFSWNGTGTKVKVVYNGKTTYHDTIFANDERYHAFVDKYVLDFTWNPSGKQYYATFEELTAVMNSAIVGPNSIEGSFKINDKDITYKWAGPGEPVSLNIYTSGNQPQIYSYPPHYYEDGKYRVIQQDFVLELWTTQSNGGTVFDSSPKKITVLETLNLYDYPPEEDPAFRVPDLYVEVFCNKGTGCLRLNWTYQPVEAETFAVAMYTGEMDTETFKNKFSASTFTPINDQYKSSRFNVPAENAHTVGIKVKDAQGNVSGWSNIYHYYPTDSNFKAPADLHVIVKNNQTMLEWTNPNGAIEFTSAVYTGEISADEFKSIRHPDDYYPITDTYKHDRFNFSPTGTGKITVGIKLKNAHNSISDWSNIFVWNLSGASGNTPQTTPQELPPAGYEDEVITNFYTYKNPFPDTDLNTLEGQAAAELYRRAVLGGYPDGQFKGSREVNRAEAAKFLLLAHYGEIKNIANNGRFPDVLDGQWYTKYVVTAANYGIIGGHPDGTFRPANPVNTAEFCKMLTLDFGLPENLSYNYNDVDQSMWFAKYAGVAQKYNLFPKRTNALEPGKYLTRDEVAVAIYQFLKNR